MKVSRAFSRASTVGSRATRTPLLVSVLLLCGMARTAPRSALPTIASVHVQKSDLAGGNSVLVTVTLTAQAPLGGSSISMTYSTESVLSNPQKGINIPAGQSSGSFALATVPTATPVAVSVTGTQGGSSVSTTVTVRPPQLQAVTLASSVQGGTRADLSVTLDGPAPPGGSLLHLAFTPNIVGLIPSSFTLELPGPGSYFGCDLNESLTGNCTQTVTVQDSTNQLLVAERSVTKTIGLLVPAVRDDRAVTGAVSLGNSKPLSFTIRRPRPSTVAFVSSCATTDAPITSVTGPATLQYRVTTFDRVAKSGAYVGLSNRSSLIVLPATLELDQGNSTYYHFACLPIVLPAATQATTLSFVATAGSATNTASITNVPLTVSSVALSKDSVTSGTTVTATIGLSAIVGSDATVQLSSSNTTAGPVPSNVTVVQGRREATINFVARVPLGSVSPQLRVIVSASYLGSTRADTVIVSR